MKSPETIDHARPTAIVPAPRPPSPRRAATALASLLLLVAGPRPADAGGITVHLATAFEAWQHVTDGTLRNALQYEQQFNYGMGALYPDTVDFFMGVHGHDVKFLNTYASQIKQRGCASNAALSTDYQCQELIAHFMGCLAHVIGDHRFDRYFLMKVDQECNFNDYGSAGVGQSQHFTDFNIDAAVSYKELTGVGFNIGIRPILASTPGSYNAFLYTCAWNFPACMNIENVMLTSYNPGNFPFATIQGAVNTHHGAVTAEPAKAIDELAFVLGGGCAWTLNDVVDNYGGVKDCGEVVARYIDKTWEIIKDGGLPQFEQSSFWDKACQTISVYDASKSGSDRQYFDYMSWIELADGVSEFQLGKLNDTPVIGWLSPTGELSVLEGDWLDKNVAAAMPAASLPAPVSAFQFSGERIGVLIGAGPVDEGHQLFVTEDFGSSWVSVAKRVLEFQLEDGETPRIGILQKKSKKSSKRTLLVQKGPLDAKKVKLRKGSKQLSFRMNGDRIAVRDKNTIWAKEGPLKPKKWVKQFKGTEIQDYQIEGDRIGVLHAGELLTKEGEYLTSELQSHGTGFSRFVLEGPWIGAVDAEGLKSKSSATDAFEVEASVPSTFGFHSGNGTDYNNYFVTAPADSALGPLRMGYLGTGGNTMYRDGLPEDRVISQLQIHEDKSWPSTNHIPSRIGVLLGDTLYVKALCIGADPTP